MWQWKKIQIKSTIVGAAVARDFYAKFTSGGTVTEFWVLSEKRPLLFEFLVYARKGWVIGLVELNISDIWSWVAKTEKNYTDISQLTNLFIYISCLNSFIKKEIRYEGKSTWKFISYYCRVSFKTISFYAAFWVWFLLAIVIRAERNRVSNVFWSSVSLCT